MNSVLPALLGLTALVGCGSLAPAPVADGGAPEDPPTSVDWPQDARAELPAGPVRVTLTNATSAGPVSLPWVAFSDGDAPWQKVEGRDGQYGFDVASGRFGVAFACGYDHAAGASVTGRVIQASVRDLRALHTSCGPAPAEAEAAATHQTTVRVTGVKESERATVVWSNPRGTFQAGGTFNGPYTTALDEGVYDLMAVAWFYNLPVRAIIRRGVAVRGDSTLDIDLTDGVRFVGKRLAVHGFGHTTEPRPRVVLLTAGGGAFSFPILPSPTEGYSGYSALDEAALAPGDLQELVFTLEGRNSSGGQRVIRGFRAPRAFDITVPRAFTSAQINVAATTPHLRPRLRIEPDPMVSFYELELSDQATWTVSLTADYLDGRSTYDFPDLGAIPGAKGSLWGSTSSSLSVSTTAVTCNLPFAQVSRAGATARDGAELRYAWQSDQLYVR